MNRDRPRILVVDDNLEMARTIVRPRTRGRQARELLAFGKFVGHCTC